MKTTLLILTFLTLFLILCKPKTEDNSSLSIKEGKDKEALLNNAIQLSFGNISSLLEEGSSASAEGKLKIEKIIKSPNEYIKIKTLDGDLAIVKLFDTQLEPDPVEIEKLFYFDSKTWIPIDFEGKFPTFEFFDLNGDGKKDILMQSGCCGHSGITVSIVESGKTPATQESNSFYYFQSSDTSSFDIKKESCEKFLITTESYDQVNESKKPMKITYDCKEKKFVETEENL